MIVPDSKEGVPFPQIMKRQSDWLKRTIGMTKPVQVLVALVIAAGVYVSVYSALAVTNNEFHSVVQIIILDQNDQPVSSGSGTIIDPDGDILTTTTSSPTRSKTRDGTQSSS